MEVCGVDSLTCDVFLVTFEYYKSPPAYSHMLIFRRNKSRDETSSSVYNAEKTVREIPRKPISTNYPVSITSQLPQSSLFSSKFISNITQFYIIYSYHFHQLLIAKSHTLVTKTWCSLLASPTVQKPIARLPALGMNTRFAAHPATHVSLTRKNKIKKQTNRMDTVGQAAFRMRRLPGSCSLGRPMQR